jgi:GR25 family glycosyltransferase involved in LPS biosynthesis
MDEQIALRIINLPHRSDRREECILEGKRAGLSLGGGNFFTARHIEENGKIGCALSHAKNLADFLFEDSRAYILVLEDDFSVRNPGMLKGAIDSILKHSQNWDVYLLGHNATIPVESTHLKDTYRVINAQTMSGYLVGRAYAPKLIETYYRSAELLKRYEPLPEQLRSPAYHLLSCDMLWKDLQIKDRYWGSIPSLIFQRPSHSDIENRTVNYGV